MVGLVVLLVGASVEVVVGRGVGRGRDAVGGRLGTCGWFWTACLF